MDIMETIGNVLTGLFFGFCFFVVCCMGVICEDAIKSWWKSRKEKGD